MTARAVLSALHASVPSLVLFRLAALRPLMDEHALRVMLGVPDGVDLAGATHVAITPFGPLVADADGRVAHIRLGEPPSVPKPDSLYGAYAYHLAVLPASEPDCLAVGRLAGEAPVALHVSARGIHADGVAAFTREPLQRDYELLRAVGVEYLGGERRGALFVARFRNRLDQHLLAARLAGFSRTDHCNRFFLGGGRLDEPLAQGLRAAAGARIADGLARTRTALATMAPAPLVSVPPPPATPEPYGDVVPLGFALAALRAAPETRSAADAVAARLLRYRRDGLWPYHAGGLVTATDTALVLQGLEEGDVAPLDAFRAPGGGYLPQLSAQTGDATHMPTTLQTRHWRLPEAGTTALVVGLRRRAGLPAGEDMRWLARRFDRRGALFFANPYLMDWALAQALGEEHADVRRRLRDELVAATRADHAFGQYDEALSTSLAILALATLGERGRIIRLAQLRLLDFIESDGRLPAATPFYSSVLVEPGTHAHGPQVVQVAGRRHAVTLYVDTERVITTALAVQALAAPADDRPSEIPAEPPHPRYLCGDAESYIAQFALPPYVEDAEEIHQRSDVSLAT
jgi:hypothetical protein